jgi:hypothetical protein
MLKTFSQIPVGKTFVEFAEGETLWRKNSNVDAECCSDDSAGFINGQLAAFGPGVVCTTEPGLSADFEVKLRLELDSAEGQLPDTHVDMGVALTEERIHVLDPADPEDPFCFLVIAPHSIERFDKVLAVDVWRVDALGKKAEASYPAPVPEWKANFSALGHLPDHEALIRGLYDETKGLLVKPVQSPVISSSVEAAPITHTTNSLEM